MKRRLLFSYLVFINTCGRDKKKPLNEDGHSKNSMMDKKLKISEIFTSLQGESSFQGFPCTFVRLSGCFLSCRWCDTKFNENAIQERTIKEIVEEVRGHGCNLVEITGGEPLIQPATPALVNALIEEGFRVLLETSGSEDIGSLPGGVHIIIDVKCPSSGMEQKNLFCNFKKLKPTDEIKFVINGRDDFEYAVQIIKKYSLEGKFGLLLSPVFGALSPRELGQWILENRLPCRLQLQLHKVIGMK